MVQQELLHRALPPTPPGTIATLEAVLNTLPPPPVAAGTMGSKEAVLQAHATKVHPQPASSRRRSPPPAAVSQQLLIPKEPPEPGARCGEVAGGTAAECAAVVCCCPCGLVNLLVLAAVWLPAGLCRRALRRKRKRGKKKAGRLRSRVGFMDDEDFGLPRVVPLTPESWPAKSPSMEVSEKEKEMWAQFYSAGFWRSPSQRE